MAMKPSILSRGLVVFAAVAMGLSVFTVPAQAQDRVGTTVAPFLTLGTGARGQSLGHAYIATATGGDALFWNPAGAARPSGTDGDLGSVFLTQHEWIGDIRYNALGTTLPIGGSGVLGLSLAFVDYGRMDVRTEREPEGTGETFGATDFSLGLTFARPLTEAFYFGGTVKYIRQSIWDMSASGIAADLGITLDTGFNGLTLAASIQNFGGKMQMGGINAQRFIDIDESSSGNNENIPTQIEMNQWDLPLSFKFGASVPVVNTHSARLELLADAHQTNDNELNADLGALLRYTVGTVNFELRGGYKDMAVSNATSHVTLGGGVDLRAGGIRLGADYGFVPYNEIGNVQMVDFRLYF